MGYYTVWVVGPTPFNIVENYDEENNISAVFPGLTFDYIAEVDEPGPAHYFATVPDEGFPAAIVTGTGQIVASPHPGSEPDPNVCVGKDALRKYLESHPDEMVTPMKWHT